MYSGPVLGRDFVRWEYGHRPILRRTFEHVKQFMDASTYAGLAFQNSASCNCYKIEKAAEERESERKIDRDIDL